MSRGDAARARDWLCSRGEEERLATFPIFPLETADVPQLMRIAVASGDDDLAGNTLAAAVRRAELNPKVGSFQATVLHSRGIWRNSADDLETAASLFDDGLRPLALASALEDLGRLMARDGVADNGGADRGVAALDRALLIYVQVGASWDAARVRGRLRRLGLRRRLDVSDRPKVGWDALTSAELAVARLAAADNTNRQIAERLFISPHTVNSHLRHIFEKLGINSRVALTRLVDIASTKQAS